MTKLEIVTKELNNLNVFSGQINETADTMTKILGDSVPYTMSLAIANYTMATFVGHFHYKIELEKDNLIPSNVIIFVLAKSGAKKTSSMLKLEKSLKDGYNVINEYRKNKAEQWAMENECDVPRINPLSNALATEAGMVQRLNDFKKEGLGLPSLYVDEISTELASNADMVPNIKLVAQLYDVGDMKSKPLKDRDNQSDEVNGMGMNALFIGSEYGILEDEAILRKFETEFISKLSRRSNFVYPDFPEEDDEVNDIESLLNSLSENKEQSYILNNKINELSKEIAESSLLNDFNHIKISDEARRLYTIYTVYCEEIDTVNEEAVELEQQHRHWKAFKLSGVYSVFNRHSQIEIQDLIEAISVVELTGNDLHKFIEKANRLPYEVMLSHYMEGGKSLTMHDMMKKKWIKKPSDMKNMIIMANNKAGNKGMFEQLEDGEIKFTSFKAEDGLGVSYITVSGTKEQRSSKTATGYIYKKTTFDKIGYVMKNDTAYAPFEFKGGIRGKEHIIGGADFIVLDIDDTEQTDVECSDMLADYNHIIARTSSSSPYKYRVILPTDITVDLPNEKWKPFMSKVAEHLGMNIDLLPKAQIYYGYKNRELIINKGYMDLEASELVKNIDVPKEKTVQRLKPNDLDDAWNKRLHTFSRAYNMDDGLHNGLWGAMKDAHKMGFSLLKGINLLEDIIDFVDRKPRKGYKKTLVTRMTTNKSEFPHWVEEHKNGME